VGDTVGGAITFTIMNADGTQSTVTTTSTDVGSLIAEINAGNIPGVTASLTTASAVGVSSTTIAAGDTGIQLTNTNPNVTIAIGATPLADSTSGGTTAMDANTAATTTISYKFAVGGDKSTNLSLTDLTNQIDAQNALSVLNSAITYVAAQDGYLGAQINTLNSISQVVSTQQTNVTAAQNAIQATDYASATSNMSKYEILSQTGIAALAQANSVQQEVTKLLQ